MARVRIYQRNDHIQRLFDRNTRGTLTWIWLGYSKYWLILFALDTVNIDWFVSTRRRETLNVFLQMYALLFPTLKLFAITWWNLCSVIVNSSSWNRLDCLRLVLSFFGVPDSGAEGCQKLGNQYCITAQSKASGV